MVNFYVLHCHDPTWRSAVSSRPWPQLCDMIHSQGDTLCLLASCPVVGEIGGGGRRREREGGGREGVTSWNWKRKPVSNSLLFLLQNLSLHKSQETERIPVAEEYLHLSTPYQVLFLGSCNYYKSHAHNKNSQSPWPLVQYTAIVRSMQMFISSILSLAPSSMYVYIYILYTLSWSSCNSLQR